MAGYKTAYLAQKALDHMLGGTTFTRPATLFVVLSTAAFTSAATGSACNEVVASGYTRLSIANNSTTWSPATAAWPAQKSNLIDFIWVTATAAWGTPLSAYLADASTVGAGNLLYGSDITNPQVVGVGDTAKIAASGFAFNEV